MVSEATREEKVSASSWMLDALIVLFVEYHELPPALHDRTSVFEQAFSSHRPDSAAFEAYSHFFGI